MDRSEASATKAELIARGRQRLISRLPDHRAAISGANGDSFLELCESYELVGAALDHWSQSDRAERDDRLREYQDLIVSLELEAVVYLLDRA